MLTCPWCCALGLMLFGLPGGWAGPQEPCIVLFRWKDVFQASQLQIADFSKHFWSPAYSQAGDRQSVLASGLRKPDPCRQVGLSALHGLRCPAPPLLSSLLQAPLEFSSVSQWIAPLLCTCVGPRATGGFLGLVTGKHNKEALSCSPSLFLSLPRPGKGRRTFHLGRSDESFLKGLYEDSSPEQAVWYLTHIHVPHL